MTYSHPPHLSKASGVSYPRLLMSWHYHFEIWKIVFFYYLIYSDKVFTVPIHFSHILWKEAQKFSTLIWTLMNSCNFLSCTWQWLQIFEFIILLYNRVSRCPPLPIQTCSECIEIRHFMHQRLIRFPHSWYSAAASTSGLRLDSDEATLWKTYSLINDLISLTYMLKLPVSTSLLSC